VVRVVAGPCPLQRMEGSAPSPVAGELGLCTKRDLGEDCQIGVKKEDDKMRRTCSSVKTGGESTTSDELELFPFWTIGKRSKE